MVWSPGKTFFCFCVSTTPSVGTTFLPIKITDVIIISISCKLCDTNELHPPPRALCPRYRNWRSQDSWCCRPVRGRDPWRAGCGGGHRAVGRWFPSSCPRPALPRVRTCGWGWSRLPLSGQTPCLLLLCRYRCSPVNIEYSFSSSLLTLSAPAIYNWPVCCSANHSKPQADKLNF